MNFLVKNIHWTEGIFLEPHHFQQAFLDMEVRISSLTADYIPYFHGISRLEIGPCEDYRFEIRAIDCRFPDGTRIVGGSQIAEGNAQIEARDFLDLKLTPENRLHVYLGIPQLNAGVKSFAKKGEEPEDLRHCRYVVVEEAVPDLAMGQNERVVAHKLYRANIIFRPEQVPEEAIADCDLLKIAEVEMVAHHGDHAPKPRLSTHYIPPSLCVSASSELSSYFDEILKKIERINQSMRDQWRTNNGASLMKPRDTFKQQTIAAALLTLRQLKVMPKMHPFTLYVKLAELMGNLSIYTEEDSFLQVPEYNHEQLGACFSTIWDKLSDLLQQIYDTVYEVGFFSVNADNLLSCSVQPDWLKPHRKLYICFGSSLPEEQVVKHVSNLKVAPENLMTMLNERRLRGMKLQGPSHYVPGLPGGPNRHFFELTQDGIFFQKLKDHPVLAIMGKSFAEAVALFVVDGEDS